MLDAWDRPYWKRAFFLGLPYFLGFVVFGAGNLFMVPAIEALAKQDDPNSMVVFGLFLAASVALVCVLCCACFRRAKPCCSRLSRLNPAMWRKRPEHTGLEPQAPGDGRC